MRPGLGLEHLILSDRSADGLLLAFDENGHPFRLRYRLGWDERWRLDDADLVVATAEESRSLGLRTDGVGHWHDVQGRPLPALDGCLDIDIWPTPFTNTFPIRRRPMAVGERVEFRMAWVSAPALTVEPKPQAYTRLADRRYRFDMLDGSGFSADLPVDDEGLVLDYPGLFERMSAVR